MNRITNSREPRGATDGDTTRALRQPGRWQPSWPGRTMSAWPYWVVLVVVVAVGVHGCKGGGEPEPAEDEAAMEGPPEMGPPEAVAPKKKPAEKPKPKQQVAEDKEPLPEDISEWVKEDYYRARRERNPRLRDAVAYLGEHFAGTAEADSAAQLLSNLLEKSEQPEPKPAPKQRGGPPMGYPGMPPGEMSVSGPPPGYPTEGYPEGGHPGEGYPGMGGPPREGMEGEAMEDEGDYDEAEAMGEYGEEAMEEYPGMEPGMMGPGMMAPGMMGPGGPTARAADSVSELIRAIVAALGVNASSTARQTLRQVVEGTFETDNNRVATLATLETLVAHLCPEYEDLLFRCLTAPEKLRALGKPGQTPGQGRSPYGGQPPYGDRSPYGDQYADAYAGGYASMRGQSSTKPLTAEELQREAFALIAPVASEAFRVRLAKHLASPTSPQEDHDLFGPFMREPHPDNVAAQMVLYSAPDIDTQTKETIEDNFIAFSSHALAGILGIPADQIEAARRAREQRARRARGGRSGMYPGMEEGMEDMEHPGMPPGGIPEGYLDEMDEPMMEEEMEGPGMPPGVDPNMYGPGAGPRGGRAGAGRSGRRSRYDAAAGSGRPSRYGTGRPGAAGQLQPEEPRMADPNLPYRLAQHMWSPQMTKLVVNRLGRIGSLEGNADLVLLASTMPVDPTRSALHRVLQRHWESGPRALESAGLLDTVISDPAFVMLVKMLPRKEPEPKAKPVRPRFGRSRLGRAGTGRYGRGLSDRGEEMDLGEMPPGAFPPGAMPGDEARMGAPEMMGPGARQAPGSQAQQKPDAAWMTTSEELVRVVCDRLLAAAKATGGGRQQAGEGLPFEVRDADEVVVAEYHLDWPSSQQAQLAGVPLGQLKLHYVRAEYQTKLSTLESYYRRQLGTADIRPIENGTWMDSIRRVPETDWRRSIDLMFTATVPAGEPFDKKKEMPVTVDILCIDVKDPGLAGE